MAKQIINTGTIPDDHTGDSLRVAFGKTNSNFTELYDGTVHATAQETANASTIVGWGDSLTFGYGGAPWPVQFATLSGFKELNRGIQGDTSTQVKTRFDANTSLYPYATVFWVGRNDVTLGVSPITIKNNIAAMVASLGHTRYLVVGVTNKSDEPTGNANEVIINQLNIDLGLIYGTRFIDIKSYLLSQGTGIGQDAIDVAAGVIPTSLRFDGTHLNSLGYSKLAAKVYEKVDILIGNLSEKLVTLGTVAKASNSGVQILDLAESGKLNIGGTTAAYVPNQNAFQRTLMFGTGGIALVHTTATEGFNNTGVGINTMELLTSGEKNTSVGALALASITTGIQNTAIGYSTLGIHTIGTDNVALGSFGLNANISGLRNIAIGTSALNSYTGSSNIAIGYQSLFTTISGSNNVSIGEQTLRLSTGNNNTALGYLAGATQSTASANTLIGGQAGDNLTTGGNNTAVGQGSLGNITTGISNVSIGQSSLVQSTLASDSNVAVGLEAIWGAGEKDNNTAVGTRALRAATTGANNISYGYQAGDNITSGSTNLIIGYDIDAISATGSNQLSIGNVILGQGLTGTGTTIAGTLGFGIAATTTAMVTFAATTTARSSFNLPTGSAPTAPVDGDVWREDNTNTGLKIRVNGVTKTITLA